MKKFSLALGCISLFLLSSCILDDEVSCETKFQVIFDYNILESDALTKQVDKVDLYLFNEDKELAYSYNQTINPNDNACIINTTDIIPGHYYAVATGQSHRIEGEGHNFIVSDMTFKPSTLDQLTARLPLEENRTSSKEINNFLIGESDLMEINTLSSHIIPIKKVTNKIRIVLLDKDADIKDDYELALHEKGGNGWINYNYHTIPDKPITYLPYLHQIETLTNTDNGGEEYKEAFVAEFSSSKLIATHPTILEIKEPNSSEILAEIDILSLLELGMIAEYDEKWGFQEYLDRKDNFVISLFFEDSTWLSATVIVNGWLVSTDHIDL